MYSEEDLKEAFEAAKGTFCGERDWFDFTDWFERCKKKEGSINKPTTEEVWNYGAAYGDTCLPEAKAEYERIVNSK